MASNASKKQTKSNPYVAVRGSSISGRGGFARRIIRKNTRIIEYIGERIDDAEAERRYDDNVGELHTTYLFGVGKNRNIDGAVGGNESRFINHSCDPNCEALDDGGRIFIHAMRTIREGEELTYDYAFVGGSEERERYLCRCGAATCRGSILVVKKPRKKRSRKSAK